MPEPERSGSQLAIAILTQISQIGIAVITFYMIALEALARNSKTTVGIAAKKRIKDLLQALQQGLVPTLVIAAAVVFGSSIAVILIEVFR